MTIGSLIPLVFLIIAIFEFRIFAVWRERGMITPRAHMIIAASSFLIPVVLYLLLNHVFPDTGAIEVF